MCPLRQLTVCLSVCLCAGPRLCLQLFADRPLDRQTSSCQHHDLVYTEVATLPVHGASIGGGRLGRKIFSNVSENKSRDRKLSISYSILVVRLLCWMAISKVSRTFWPPKSELVSTASHWNILAGLDDFACVILDSRGCTLCTNFYIFGIHENALTITQAQREPAPPLGAQPPDPFPPMHDLLNPPLHAGSFRHRLHCNRLDIKFRPRCCPLVGQFAYSSPCWVTLAFFHVAYISGHCVCANTTPSINRMYALK